MTERPATPKEMNERADDVSAAFLLLLERLPADARAAFLLHELFGADYAEVAAALGLSKAACRRLVNLARARMHDDRR